MAEQRYCVHHAGAFGRNAFVDVYKRQEPHHDEELAAAFVPLDEIVEKVREIIDFDSDEDGYMPLSQIGVMLGRLYADFDSRNYGFSKLHKLIDHTGAFETKYEQLENGSKNLVVRNK